MKIVDQFYGKKVVVTGSCGTVGAEIVRQLVSLGAEHIVALDNNESELFYQEQAMASSGKVTCFLADLRDIESLKLRFSGADIVLHSAALKHVGLCESSPNQAVATNILGTQNVIDAALLNNVERVIFTSSDKAVNPTNVMGTSKLMGERLMTAAAESSSSGATIFASTRFGNVLGSRGSVVPIFERQLRSGEAITLTDRDMTRFIMSLEEAVELVLRSVWLATGGEVFVTKMPIARIEDLAVAMHSIICGDKGKALTIEEIGVKPGEKMYEELMNDEEVRRTFEYEDFLVVISAFSDVSSGEFLYLLDSRKTDRPYNSSEEACLSVDELKSYLLDRKVL